MMGQNRQHTRTQPLRLVIIGLLALLATGCSTVHPRTSAGTGTYAHVGGVLSWTYPATLDEVWSATLAALTELQIPIRSQMIDGLGGFIEAERGEKVKVRLRLTPQTDITTRLSVRFGTAGNRQESRRVHAAVRNQLGF